MLQLWRIQTTHYWNKVNEKKSLEKKGVESSNDINVDLLLIKWILNIKTLNNFIKKIELNNFLFKMNVYY